MPRGSQFGYLFTDDLSSGGFDLGVTCGHELGHGLFQLEHTFSKVYGEVLPEGSTRNLMDYGGGSELAKWQWDYLYDPGIVLRLFEKDKDTMLKGVFYDGIALTPLVDYKFHYNFGDIYSVESRNGELSCGRYNRPTTM